MLASCTQEEMGDSPDAQSGEIRFEIGFAPQNEAMQTNAQTRVATDTQFNSTWENGDEIGVYAVKHGEQLLPSGNFIHNVKLTYTGDTWTASKGIYWPKDGTKYDFYAYYPYDDAATDPTSIAYNVHTGQSATTNIGGTEKSNYNLSDLLMAKNNNSGKGYGKGETVRLSFTHALAMVQVNVSKSMIGDYPADMLKVELNGCSTDCKLNLSTQSATLPAIPASPLKIKMYPCPNDNVPGIYAYRALVPVQEIAAGTVLFNFEYNGSTLLRSKPLAEPLSLVAGKAEKFDMTFPFTSATVSAKVRLAGLFTAEELAAITHLKVMGEMTAADFTTIRESMTSITSLDLGAATVENDAIPNGAFFLKTSLQEFVFPRDIKIIGRDAFDNCSGLTGSLTIPQGVTTIGDDAFFRCSGFTGPLTIPEGVTTIGAYAFDSCSGFTGSLKIPESVTTIGNEAFYGCSGFTGSLIIPKGVTTIESQVFEYCTGFNSLTIPEGVTKIGDRAFNDCRNLASITCHVLEPGSVAYGSDVFKMIPGNITVYVPETAVDNYSNHDVWKLFFNTFAPIRQPNNP